MLGFFFSSAEQGSPTTCSMSFKSNGSIEGNSGGPLDVAILDGEWWTTSPESGIGASYDVRATELAGNVSTGTVGSWLSLATTRTWTRTSGGLGEQEVTLLMEVRRASDEVVLGSAEYTLNASGGA